MKVDRARCQGVSSSGAGRRCRSLAGRDVAATFLRWTFMRAIFHRGYVLVSGLYFVIDAHLSASQLVALGTVVGVTLLLSDLPTGVLSDAFSRKWPLVIGHAFLSAGMVMTGVVTEFPLLLVTQVLWGLGWGFSSGADVAWITDELRQPERIARELTARARWDLVGGAAGMIAFGLLAWATGLGGAIVVAGVAMAAVGIFVAACFSEDHFNPVSQERWSASLAIFRRGTALVRRDGAILLMLTSTLLINGASIVSWLFPRQLIDLGFPNDPVLWYTALGILSSVFGAAVLRLVEARIDGAGAAGRVYAFACGSGMLGLLVLAYAPAAIIGCIGVLLVSGVALNVTRAVSVIWVNWRASSEVRATLHSFLGQAESLGEILGGFSLALMAKGAGVPMVLTTAAILILLAGAMLVRSRGGVPAPVSQVGAAR